MSANRWIEKRHDPDDRRVVRLFPSPKAERHQQELIALRREANQALLADFSLEEQVLLKRMLRDLMVPEAMRAMRKDSG